MAGRYHFTGKPGEDVFQEIDLEDSEDGRSCTMDPDEDGAVSPYCNYPRPYVPMSPQYIPHRGLVRYRTALKHLIPIRKKKKKKKIISIDEAGLFSTITFSWMSKYIYLAYKKGLTVDDIPLCSPLDSCDLNAQRLESLWQDELVRKGPNDASFGKVVWKFARTRIIIACIAFSLSCAMGFLSPTIFMRKLLEYSEDPDVPDSYGIIWAFSLTLSDLMRILLFAVCWGVGYRTATRLRAACLAMVYRKLMRLHSLGHKSVGELINLYGNDGLRLFNMIVFGPMAIGGPMVAVCGLVYISYLLGPWALMGMLAFLLFYPVQYGLSRLTGHYRGKTILKSDERIDIMNEILNGIKFIKMYSWESWFSSAVESVRKQELEELKKTCYCQSISISMAPTIPVISGIIMFLSHVLAGGNLTAAQAFPVLTFATKQFRMALKHLQESCFAIHEGFISFHRFKAFPIITILHTQLRNALNNMRYGTENFIEGKITLSRLQDVLVLEENATHVSRNMDKSLALSISDGTFAWEHFKKSARDTEDTEETEKERLDPVESNDNAIILHSINFSVVKGSLVGICGPVGSGKSSLLLACLGQMKMLSGQLSRVGRSAYVGQQAWIENATLKQNILFGEPFDPKRYINALYCCALSEEVNLLPGGDETEIGERGVNLSGGQKQRVSLARALYSDRNIYFLDDPLSAVDGEVASHIFEKCILGALNKKTVILVTHQTRFLQKCDEILVLKEGRIVERGAHHELLSKGREYSSLVQSTAVEASSPKAGEEKKETGDTSKGLEKVKQSPGKGLTSTSTSTSAEEQTKGEVKPYAYHAYVKAAGGYFVSLLVILSVLINVGSNNFSSWWLAMWIKAGSGNTSIFDPMTNETILSRNINDNPDLGFYMEIYGLVIIVIIATSVLRGLIFTRVTISASKILHNNMFAKLMTSPIRYFETTPTGRIQNLFSRDLDEVDARLPGAVETMLQNIWVVMFAFLIITLVFPWFVVPLLVLIVLYYFITKIFRVAIRDLKRIESISRSPIFGSVSSTVRGLPTIRAFEKENEYVSQFSKILDENSTSMFLSYNAMRWMATRLDSISIAITCITALLVVVLKGHVSPELAGLALTYAAHISGVFQFTIRLMSDTETRFISVERIVNHTEKLVPEGNNKRSTNVPPDWPSKGSVKFQNVKLSYDKDLPDVLNEVSFSVKPQEKIGVVGRTGAGKSSLAVALFRLVELKSGRIIIDGIDISCVPLTILRSRLSVIPQDPILFKGSLRSNLDPFDKYPDDKIWESLRKTKLLTKIKSMPEELKSLVGEGGLNLSVGERQLVCLARALLRESKVLILDEATASVDPETEADLYATIEKEFSNCTVITIAHRLNTVRSCNRILVMDQGMVLEYDEPDKLLADPNSRFAKMSAPQ